MRALMRIVSRVYRSSRYSTDPLRKGALPAELNSKTKMAVGTGLEPAQAMNLKRLATFSNTKLWLSHLSKKWKGRQDA